MPANPVTPRLGLVQLVASQSQPEVLIDTALRVLEAFAGTLSVKSRATAAPPGSPGDGDCYIIAAPASGAWAGSEGGVAVWIGSTGVWFIVQPGANVSGLEAYVQDENAYVRFDFVGSPTGWVAR